MRRPATVEQLRNRYISSPSCPSTIFNPPSSRLHDPTTKLVIIVSGFTMFPVLGKPFSHNQLDSGAFTSTTIRLLSREDLDRRPTDFGEDDPSIVFGPSIATPVCVMPGGADISAISILIATIGARQKMSNMSGEG
jgi:hypothetical protein